MPSFFDKNIVANFTPNNDIDSTAKFAVRHVVNYNTFCIKWVKMGTSSLENWFKSNTGPKMQKQKTVFKSGTGEEVEKYANKFADSFSGDAEDFLVFKHVAAQLCSCFLQLNAHYVRVAKEYLTTLSAKRFSPEDIENLIISNPLEMIINTLHENVTVVCSFLYIAMYSSSYLEFYFFKSFPLKFSKNDEVNEWWNSSDLADLVSNISSCNKTQLIFYRNIGYLFSVEPGEDGLYSSGRVSYFKGKRACLNYEIFKFERVLLFPTRDTVNLACENGEDSYCIADCKSDCTSDCTSDCIVHHAPRNAKKVTVIYPLLNAAFAFKTLHVFNKEILEEVDLEMFYGNVDFETFFEVFSSLLQKNVIVLIHVKKFDQFDQEMLYLRTKLGVVSGVKIEGDEAGLCIKLFLKGASIYSKNVVFNFLRKRNL